MTENKTFQDRTCQGNYETFTIKPLSTNTTAFTQKLTSPVLKDNKMLHFTYHQWKGKSLNNCTAWNLVLLPYTTYCLKSEKYNKTINRTYSEVRGIALCELWQMHIHALHKKGCNLLFNFKKAFSRWHSYHLILSTICYTCHNSHSPVFSTYKWKKQVHDDGQDCEQKKVY